MIDFIKGKTKELMFKCCEKYAAKQGIEVDGVQLILGLNEEGNTYTMCVDYVRKEEYTIMQVLDVKIDFLGYSQLAPPFILKSLVRFSKQYNIDLDKINVMCVPVKKMCVKKYGTWLEVSDEEFEASKNKKIKNDIRLFLYNDNDYVSVSHTVKIEENDEVKEEFEEAGISFDQLFSEEDIELPTM